MKAPRWAQTDPAANSPLFAARLALPVLARFRAAALAALGGRMHHRKDGAVGSGGGWGRGHGEGSNSW